MNKSKTNKCIAFLLVLLYSFTVFSTGLMPENAISASKGDCVNSSVSSDNTADPNKAGAGDSEEAINEKKPNSDDLVTEEVNSDSNVSGEDSQVLEKDAITPSLPKRAPGDAPTITKQPQSVGYLGTGAAQFKVEAEVLASIDSLYYLWEYSSDGSTGWTDIPNSHGGGVLTDTMYIDAYNVANTYKGKFFRVCITNAADTSKKTYSDGKATLVDLEQPNYDVRYDGNPNIPVSKLGTSAPYGATYMMPHGFNPITDSVMIPITNTYPSDIKFNITSSESLPAGVEYLEDYIYEDPAYPCNWLKLTDAAASSTPISTGDFLLSAVLGASESQDTNINVVNHIDAPTQKGGSNNGKLYQGFGDTVTITANFTEPISLTDPDSYYRIYWQDLGETGADAWKSQATCPDATGLTVDKITEVITGASGGSVTFSFTTTAAVPNGKYFFEINRKASGDPDPTDKQDNDCVAEGSIIVSAAVLTATTDVKSPVQVTLSDSAKASIAGSDISLGLTTTATPAKTLSYQWEKNNYNGTAYDGWGDISGATNSTFAITNSVQADDDNDKYRCKLSQTISGSSIQTATSSDLVLYVKNPVQNINFFYQRAALPETEVDSSTKLLVGDALSLGATAYATQVPPVSDPTATDYLYSDFVPSATATSTNSSSTKTLAISDIGVKYFSFVQLVEGREYNKIYCNYDSNGNSTTHSEYGAKALGQINAISVSGASSPAKTGDLLSASLTAEGTPVSGTDYDIKWQYSSDRSVWIDTGYEGSSYTIESNKRAKYIRAFVIGTGGDYVANSAVGSTSNPGIGSSDTGIIWSTVTGANITGTKAAPSAQHPVVGVELTAMPTPSLNPPLVASYQWVSGGVDIPAATTNKYTPTDADMGKVISVKVSGLAASYCDGSGTGTTTTAVLKA
ncbi:MAG: hypothetical protein ACRCUS_09835, partial [Anaerovoracaceae bacterium]